MTTEVDIANMALGAVGARAQIASFQDNTKESNVCALFFAPIRDALLRQVKWGFSRKQVNLTLLADATAGGVVPTPWTYKYQYPSDCAKFWYMVPMYQSVQPSSQVPGTPVTPIYRGPPVKWIMNSDLDSSQNPILTLLTNQIQAVGVYGARVPVPLWDSMFIEAMVGALAAKICVPVSGDKKLVQLAIESGKNALNEARVADANESIQQQETMPDWMRVRGYLSDYAYPDQFLWSEDPGILSAIS